MAGSNRIYFDRVAVISAIVGIVLMSLTIVWKVNLVEGSVVSPFLLNTAYGRVLHLILLITCMPVWIAVVISMARFIDSTALLYSVMLAVQAILFFAIGKLISLCIRVVKKRFRAAT